MLAFDWLKPKSSVQSINDDRLHALQLCDIPEFVGEIQNQKIVFAWLILDKSRTFSKESGDVFRYVRITKNAMNETKLCNVFFTSSAHFVSVRVCLQNIKPLLRQYQSYWNVSYMK